MVMNNKMSKKTTLALALAMTMGAGLAEAAPWYGNLTVYDPIGVLTAPVDSSIYGEELVSLASPTPFFGLLWTSHDMTTYSQGTYTIDTIQGGVYTFSVDVGQVGAHILFDWGAMTDIDIITVWDVSVGTCAYGSVAGSGTCRNYTSTDIDGDGILGIGMIDGGFPDTSANFDMSAPVPVPAAVWLFGSGLIGLIGVAKRKKA